MNIHKFNTKPKTNLSKTIHWQPLKEVNLNLMNLKHYN